MVTRALGLTFLLFLAGCSCQRAHEAPASPPTVAAVAPTTTGPAPQVVAAPQRRSMLISINVENAPLDDVMDQIGAKVGWNILVDPKVQETVTINLRGVPWREAVELIAKITRCDVQLVQGRVDGTY